MRLNRSEASRPVLAAGLLILGFAAPGIAQIPAATADTARDLRHESLRVRSGSIELDATLVLPAGAERHPAVVLISGAQEGVFMPAHPLPQRIAGAGVAVLVLGKRGVGSSTGNWRRESFEQRAEDVRRALDLLADHPSVDPSRLGVVGHSQGGWVAQIVAADDARVGFVVLLAGPGQTVREQILTDERIHRERRGMPAAQVEREIRRLDRQLGVLSSMAPLCRALRAHYLCHILHFDPIPYLERVTVPVLALYGELDPEVPPDPNVDLVTAALERAGNHDVTVRVFPRANHQFWLAETGLRDEYHHMEQVFAPGYLELVSCWVRDRAQVASPP